MTLSFPEKREDIYFLHMQVSGLHVPSSSPTLKRGHGALKLLCGGNMSFVIVFFCFQFEFEIELVAKSCIYFLYLKLILFLDYSFFLVRTKAQFYRDIFRSYFYRQALLMLSSYYLPWTYRKRSI